MYAIQVLSLVLLLVAVYGQAEEGPIRETVYGNIQGSYKEYNDASFEEYLGVPYGSPPIGELRFAKPVSPEPWGGVRDSTEHALWCTQFFYASYNETSEDCLYLDIYVPGRDREGDALPVLVWIHGGGYIFGKTESYTGYDPALKGDIIVVAVAYRLSTLGWLSTEDDVSPGNYGLWDVKLALEWVKDNIVEFGGDPDVITIMGQSAGGCIASHVMISPQTKPLIKRGISLSGHSSGFFGTSLPGNIARTTKTTARLVGCRFLNTSQELVDCLRTKPASELDFWGLVAAIGVQRQIPNWVPIIDGDFVIEHPQESWKRGAAANLDLLTGNTYHDAASFILVSDGVPNSTFNIAATERLLNLSLTYVTNHFPGDTNEMINAIVQEYPALEDENLDTRTEAMIEAFTHWWFQTWAHFEASQHMKTLSNTYLYNFHYDPSFLEYQFDWVQGSHSNDLYFLFGYPYKKEFKDEKLGKDYNEDDYLVNNYLQSYYVNFIRNGNPNEGLPVPVEWPTFDNVDRNYLEISNQPQVLQETEELRAKYRFWNQEFPPVSIPDESADYKRSNAFQLDYEEDMNYSLLPDEEFELEIEAILGYLQIVLTESLSEKYHSEELEQLLLFIETESGKRKNNL